MPSEVEGPDRSGSTVSLALAAEDGRPIEDAAGERGKREKCLFGEKEPR